MEPKTLARQLHQMLVEESLTLSTVVVVARLGTTFFSSILVRIRRRRRRALAAACASVPLFVVFWSTMMASRLSSSRLLSLRFSILESCHVGEKTWLLDHDG